MTTAALKLQKELEMSCPYCNIETAICKAAISALSLGPIARLTYCDNESYDNCPVFLAKILRWR
ncbi:MAG: hypothetical protein HY806_08340 [Nitrospirae bacterium]|nr:hypothetical protein [Nitrospirota bacterium]